MRSLPGRGGVPQEEQLQAKLIVKTTVEICLYIQQLLTTTASYKGAKLLIQWENPSSAGEKGLMHYLTQSGLLNELKLQISVTSQCCWGHPYSKPTHLAHNFGAEYHLSLMPPCIKQSYHGKCPEGQLGLHKDVTKISRQESYKLPVALVNHMSWQAWQQIMDQNQQMGYVFSEPQFMKNPKFQVCQESYTRKGPST